MGGGAAAADRAGSDFRSGEASRNHGAGARKYLTKLSGAFAAAQKDCLWITRNPVQSIRRPPNSKGRFRFLNDDERDALLIACRSSDEARLYPLVLTKL